MDYGWLWVNSCEKRRFEDIGQSQPWLLFRSPDHYASAVYDLATKWEAYRRNGVREYIVWQGHERRIDWLQRYDNQEVPLPST